MLHSAFNVNLIIPSPEPRRAPRTSTIVLQLSADEAARIAPLSQYERAVALLALPAISPEEGAEGVATATEAVKRERERRNERRAARRRSRMMSGNTSGDDAEKAVVGRKPTTSRDTPRDVSVAVVVDLETACAVVARSNAVRLSASDYARRMLLGIDLAQAEPHQSSESMLQVALAVARYARGGFQAADMGEDVAA